MVDLHIHTKASSDAFTSPEEVVSIAYSRGLSAIAITDHKTVKGIAAAMKAGKELGLEVIPGIEIHAICNMTIIHITGLFIDPAEPSLLDFLSKLEAGKREIMDKLRNNNYDIFENHKFHAEEVISYIHKAGGLAVLAHPLRYEMEWDELDAMLAHLKRCGLDGMEVYYYTHDESERDKLLSLARKYSLLRSGGSDSHGYEKQDGRDIGKGLYGSLVPNEALEEMKLAKK